MQIRLRELRSTGLRKFLLWFRRNLLPHQQFRSTVLYNYFAHNVSSVSIVIALCVLFSFRGYVHAIKLDRFYRVITVGVRDQWPLTALMRSLPIDSKSHAGVHKRTYILPEETTIDIVLVVNKYGGGHHLIINFLIKCITFSAPVDWRTFVNGASASANFCISLLTKLQKFAMSLHNNICSIQNC